MYAFVIWLFATLPLSLFIERSAAYAVWTHGGRTYHSHLRAVLCYPGQFHSLLRWFILSFVLLAAFGFLQFAVGFAGIDLFVSEWWIPNKVARINGLSYEPSYYATYLVAGWVLSMYLVEKRAFGSSPRLVRAGAWFTSLALLLCTSRTGWIMMALWMLVRVGLFVSRTFTRGRLSVVSTRRMVLSGAATAACAVLALSFSDRLASHVDDISWIGAGIGLFGEASYSRDDRVDSFSTTWQAFLKHPVVGAGIGAVPIEIAAQKGAMVLSLDDAKANEGFSLVLEILASTGLIGGGLLGLFWLDVARAFRAVSRCANEFDRYALRGLAWSVAWISLAMFFNQNFLRLYIFVDIAILICGLVALGPARPGSVARRGA